MSVQSYASKIFEYISSFIKSEDNSSSNNGKPVSFSLERPEIKSSRGSIHVLNDKRTSPNDKEEFHRRVDSFQLFLWTAAVPPSLCAKYGWFLKEKNLLKCVTCSAIVCSSLPSFRKRKSYENSILTLKSRLRASHKSWCGWVDNICPPEFLHPPISMPASFFYVVRAEAKKISTQCVKIPFLNTQKLLTVLGLEMYHLNLIMGKSEDLTKSELSAAILAVLGWKFEETERVKCDLCLRSISFWQFLPAENEEKFIELFNMAEKTKENKIKKDKKEKQAAEESRRKQRESRRERLALEEAEKEREKEREHNRKVEEALKKLSEFESRSGGEDFDTNQPEVNAELETSLLSEVFEDDPLGHKYDHAKKSLQKNGFQNQPADNSFSEPHSPTDDENKTSSKDGNSYSPLELANADSRSSADDKSSNRDEDNLWLEAVKSCKEIESKHQNIDNWSDKSVKGSDYTDSIEDDNGSLKEQSSPPVSDDISKQSSKKRTRDADTPSEGFDFENEDTFEKASKCPKFDGVPTDDFNDNNGKSEIEETRNTAPASDTPTDSRSIEDDENFEMDEVSEKLFAKMKSRELDPTRQHRYWCGWVSRCSSFYLADEAGLLPADTTDTVGYQSISGQIRAIFPDAASKYDNLAHSDKYSSNVEGLRAVREILDNWTLPTIDEEVQMN